jgi:thiamine biosynthesis protein ThiS
MNDVIPVVINGEQRRVPAGVSVAHLLVHLGIAAARVAVERNLELLPRAHWEATSVAPGDRYEIVHLVGGG